MARQSTAPVLFNRSRRTDDNNLMTSGRAGVVVPIGYIPLLAGDSCSGRAGIDLKLKEMPRPLLNGVFANFQAWFVPKSAHPQFPGRDELMASYTGHKVRQLGKADREPAPFFTALDGAAKTTAAASKFFKTLGLHVPAGEKINTDLIDAFTVIYNFRLAAHSNKLKRRKYAAEDISEATTLPPAFWPSSRFSRVVGDYERALVVGSLDLDVIKGRLPISGIGIAAQQAAKNWTNRQTGGRKDRTDKGWRNWEGSDHLGEAFMFIKEESKRAGFPAVFAEMAGQHIGVSVADIDKARTTQAFAKLRQAYAGNDTTGFNNDDAIVALLLQGIGMPQPDDFKRPWLLDSKRVPVGFAQRFATNSGQLDQNVNLGFASASLSLNVPKQDVSGVIIMTVEVLPERIDERMSDNWLLSTTVSDLPDALRDVQRVEPVDLVLNHRIDAKHAAPKQLYGYEPMNDAWNRNFTRLGGEFYMATPGGGFKETRANIWQTEIVNPKFTKHHFLAPSPFPHDPFSDQRADAFECVCRHSVSIVGLTQIGDVLAENNDDYGAVVAAQEE